MAFLTPDKTYTWNGVPVKEYFVMNHNSNNIAIPTANRGKTVGVTIHNTPDIVCASGTTKSEQHVRATRNGAMGSVIVHFYIDEKEAWFMHPLEKISWHSGDGTTDPNSGNSSTISIEVIGNSAAAEENAAKITAYLMKKYNWTIENNLYTHSYWIARENGYSSTRDNMCKYNAGYKTCPLYILPHWDTFKNKIRTYMGNTTETKPVTSAVLYRIRKTWADTKSQIGAYSNLEGAKKACPEGYSVFDEKGNVVYTKATSAAAPSTPSIVYRSYGNRGWNGEITNYNEKDGNGYSGYENGKIYGMAAKCSVPGLKYRVHTLNGKWYNWIFKSDINDWISGVAGTKSEVIDGIQLDLNSNEYAVEYRVSYIGSTGYLPWVRNVEDYAGIYGKAIDKIQMRIVKK